MIHIVTGEIDSGKTTMMKKIYSQLGGDGFVTDKIYIEKINAGQRIVRLSSGDDMVFSLKTMYLPDDFDKAYRYFDYCFSKEGMDFAHNILKSCLKNNISPIYIDEIGPLEIRHKSGLYEIMKYVLKFKLDLYIAVRKKCLDEFADVFNVKNYTVIYV